MPTYQYSCNDCGHFHEIFQSFSDDSLTVCPECGGRLRKVFNAVGVVFKGSGFYRNDSRQKVGAEKTSSETGSETKAGANGSGSGSKSGAEKAGPSSKSNSGSESSTGGSSSTSAPAPA